MPDYPCFPMFVDLSDRRVVVIGAGRIAARRAGVLVQFCGNVAVVAPEVHPDVEALAAAGKLSLYRRPFERSDLEGADMVLAATDDPAVNRAVAEACRARGIPVNHAGDRRRSDFYFPGVVREGDVVVGVTASGRDHRRARDVTEAIRRRLAEARDETGENA